MPNKKAFMLIEVLVTVLIISISILLINQTFSFSLRALSVSNSYRQAIFFLENKIFDIYFDMHRGELASSSEEKIFPDGKLSWEQAITPPKNQDLKDAHDKDKISIKRFFCSLSWQAAGHSRNINLLTYIPTYKD
jgi:competence protein ComGC